jgi:hypothetical protein
MNSKPSLDSAYAQVNRAAELLVGLKRLHDSVIDAYKKATTAEVKPNVVMDPGDGPRVGTAIMFDSGDYQFKVPDKVRILTGEISNSLRSALDYLIARLVELDEGVVTSNNQFPIEQRPKQFRENRNRHLAGVNDAHAARIEALQPYSGRDPWLLRLQELSNLHKHRDLVETPHDVVITVTASQTEGKPGELSLNIGTKPLLSLRNGPPILDALEMLKSQVTRTLDSFKSEF